MAASQPPRFDWRVYADATCAGLTALIPVPLVDLAFEATFRRRMPATIARASGRSLRPEVLARLAHRDWSLLGVAGCLALPSAVARYLARVVWRKVVYVLAVADAASLVSAYWHRAYLMDHMIRAGHLDPGADAGWALLVFQRVIREADTSPLVGVARQVASASRRIGGLLVRARRRGSPGQTETLGEILSAHWTAAERSLRAVAHRYNELYVQRPEDLGRSDSPPPADGSSGPAPDRLDDPGGVR
ncbi:MAG TPA: hypothetical protein PKJ99_03545 [Thermoanaerobaculales bacterium]|nr:hypothetical protein [Thermoanaerobaculales bacterium]HPA79963.1 hypothetical protein [Thermoanaerobaculales bacterium]HQN96690.1 hypothetical protein [Thermoanaerobaculales bacterium]HQP43386.1 hypothetical protein [Thermoanaerobaculales bacterium]